MRIISVRQNPEFKEKSNKIFSTKLAGKFAHPL